MSTITTTIPADVLDTIPAPFRYKYGVLDDRDAALKAEIQACLNSRKVRTGPRVGDFVEFANGVTERISHLWDTLDTPGAQTSPGGSWHVSAHGASFSGSLNSIIRLDTLTDTGETREGSGWFWHHGMSGGDRGVPTMFTFRVYRSTADR